MKKILMMLAFVGFSVAAMAQDEDSNTPVMKHSVSTNSFGSNWFVQANIMGSAFYGGQERAAWEISDSPFKGFRTNLGVSLALGKWFTPGIGLRTKVNGIWGRTVLGDDKKTNASKYWMAQEQVLLNFSNLLCGYSETRVWNFIPYFGGGVARNMTYNTYSMGVGVGILNTFRLCDKWLLNAEIGYNIFDNGFDGCNPSGTYMGFVGGEDRMVNLEIGFTYKLGKGTWKKTPDVEAMRELSQAQIDALNAQLADSQAENDKLRSMLAAQPKPVETKKVTEIHVAPVSVFFNIGKSRIASKKDLQNVKDLVEVAKATGSKIAVDGYADSKTGSAAYNQTLSEKRAIVVADELVKMGMDRNDIVIKANGGVNVLSPVSYNRRATVSIVK